MKNRLLYLLLILSIPSLTSFAQDDNERCSTMEALEQRIQNDPSYAKFYNYVNSDGFAQRSPPCVISPVTVPIAFHFDDSFSCANPQCLLDEIQDQIDALNVAFGDNTQDPLVQQLAAACPAGYPIADVSTGTEINFCLGVPPANNAQGLDPACDPAITVGDFCGGINFCGGNGAGPDWAGFLNIFVVGPSGGLLGVADGIPGNANGDGVTVTGSVFGGDDGGCNSGGPLDTDTFFAGGATLVHEIGHYLGIFHVWGDGGCGVVDFPNAGPCDVLDTPDMSASSTNCPTVGTTCAGLPQSCGNYEFFHNYMDYTSDACLAMFSQDQANVMNYWANQLYSNTTVACANDQNPTVLTTVCENQACACPAMVTQPLALTEDLCLIAGDYTLPTDLSAVISDLPGIFVWSSGNYLSAGGTTIAGTTYTPATPASCIPTTETLYLNLTCSGDPLELDAGTVILTVYPDPRNFTETDLVNISDGDCNGPGVLITPGCEPYVTVTQNGGPAFPVTSGSGTVDYDVTLNYPAGCCEVPGAEIILEGTIMSATFDDASADQVCDPNDPNLATPAIWQITFNIPPAQNATNVNPTGLGSIKEVCIDLTLNGGGDAVVMSLDSPDCNAYEWENLWLGSAFTGGSNGGSTTLCFTAGTANGDFDGTFDGDDGTSSSFMGCLVNGNMWDFWIADYNCYLGNATGGTLNSATITFCDGSEPPITGGCDFTAQASYDCTNTGVGYCDNICFAEYVANPGPDDFVDATLCVTTLGCADNPDASCLQTLACDDGDQCTENEMETTVIASSEVCTACVGTPVATCTLPSVAQACDDADLCTENDMEEVDACDATVVCVPCAGTPIATCTLPSVAQACDDADPCTENDMEEVDACDATVVCVPCAGTPVATCTLPSVAQACDDADPCTENDMEEVDACDATVVCVPCAGTPVAACALAPVMQACDDGDPCTSGEMEGIDACDNTTVCVPCGGGMAVSPACGDPTASNYDADATCIDNTVCAYGTYCDNPCYAEYAPNPGMNDTPDPALCISPLGCADLATIDQSCISTQACDDANPCTENEEETIILADGSACGDCGLNATAVTPACGDPAADNYDMNAICIDNTLCTYSGEYCDNPCFAEYNPNPAMGDTPNAALCATALGCADLATIDPSCISTQACDDSDPCTENEEETFILADGSACGDCGLNSTVVTPACGDPVATNYDMNATCIDNTLCEYDGDCEDSISGNVSITETTCGLTGVEVIILDSAGIPVAGSPVTIDMNGDYFLAGPFPCGNYTAELDLTTLPPCYTELEGETGPVGFTVNGDGVADGADFSNQAMVPTLSQWGLMILALLLMTFGAIRLSVFRLRLAQQ